MKNFLLLVLTALLFSSCGVTNISTPNSVALSHGNFKFVKTVQAKTTATYVFAIGGMSKGATEDVVEKLKKTARLKPNQALADIRIKTTTKTYLLCFFMKRSLTATASVVEFLGEESVRMTTYTESENISTQIDVSEDVIGIINTQPSFKDACNYAEERLKALRQALVNNTIGIEIVKNEYEKISKWRNTHPHRFAPALDTELNKIKRIIEKVDKKN